MWRNTVREGGVSKKPVRAICMINVCDGPMETVMLNTCG